MACPICCLKTPVSNWCASCGEAYAQFVRAELRNQSPLATAVWAASRARAFERRRAAKRMAELQEQARRLQASLDADTMGAV